MVSCCEMDFVHPQKKCSSELPCGNRSRSRFRSSRRTCLWTFAATWHIRPGAVFERSELAKLSICPACPRALYFTAMQVELGGGIIKQELFQVLRCRFPVGILASGAGVATAGPLVNLAHLLPVHIARLASFQSGEKHTDAFHGQRQASPRERCPQYHKTEPCIPERCRFCSRIATGVVSQSSRIPPPSTPTTPSNPPPTQAAWQLEVASSLGPAPHGGLRGVDGFGLRRPRGDGAAGALGGASRARAGARGRARSREPRSGERYLPDSLPLCSLT